MDIKHTIGIVLAALILAGGFVVGIQSMPGDGTGAPGVNLFPSERYERSIALPGSYTLSHSESGSIVYSTSTASTTTLPAARDGLVYTFVVGQAIGAGNWKLDSAEGDNIDGTLIVAGAVVDCRGEDQINFVTDGEQIGDYVRLRSNGSQWFIEDSGGLTASKITCTDPS